MDLGDLLKNFSVLAVTGALLLLLGKIYAASRLQKIKEFFFLSAVAEIGYLLIGLGIGDSNGLIGAGFYLSTQLILRLIIYISAVQLIKISDSNRLEGMRGLISREPLLATVFGFGLFSALGFSPFKGSPGKLLVIYSLVSGQHYVLAFLVIAASLIETGCFLKIFHEFCKRPEAVETEQSTSGKTSVVIKSLLVGMGLITVFLSLFQESILHFFHIESTVKLEGTWSWLVLLPYLGAFAVYILGKASAALRNLAAVGISTATVIMIWQLSNLDGLSRLFALIMAVIGLLVTLYSTAYFKKKSYAGRYFFFLILMQASLVGITTTNHLGDFYTFWELMTLTSYFLVIHEQTQEALNAGYKYFMMCTAGAYAILIAALAIYDRLGVNSLNTLSTYVDKLPPGFILILSLAFFIGFAVKIGLVPVHSWLPAAHPVAPSSISAPMSGILTKIGIYGVLKLVFMVFGVALLSKSVFPGGLHFGALMSFLGAITVLYGDIKALKQTDVKKMLAFSTMAQVGEIIIALGCANYLSLVGGLSHVLNHAIMKNLLFLAIGALIYRVKSQEISKLKGIGKQMPFTALCFSIGILGIMGLPPFGGFISKFLMLYGLIEAQQWVYAGVILIGSFIGSFYYLRLIKTIFFEEYKGAPVSEVPMAMLVPSVTLASLVIINGLFPQFALSLVKPAADVIALASHISLSAIPNLNIIWPLAVVIPMAGGIIAYIVGKRSRQWAGGVGVITLAITTANLVMFKGDVPSVALTFALLIASVGMLNMFYSMGYMDHSHAQNRFYFFFLTMIGGLIGVALSKDLFSFFAFWEIMSSWALYFTIIHEETSEALREGFKYFIFNYAGATLMLFGMLILTVSSGTFDFGLLADKLPELPQAELFAAIALMTLGFLMKAAMLPWRIDYQMHPSAAPTPVSGYISAVLLKSAPFAVIKLIYLTVGLSFFIKLSNQVLGFDLGQMMAWIGGITIIWATVKALQQNEIKRVLIFSTVSQMGYIILGISLGTTLGIAGGLLHLVNHMMFKNLLFLAAGAIMYKTGAKNLDEIGGLAKRMPVTVTVFAVGAFSTIGIPPFNGFFSKWLIYQAAIAKGEILLAIISLVASVVTMAYLIKFLHAAFFGQLPEKLNHVREVSFAMLAPMIVLAAACVLFGVLPGIPLQFIAKIQGELGLTAIDPNMFGLHPSNGLWSAGVLVILLLMGGFISGVIYWACNRKVRYTEVYTCGVVDLKPEEIQVSSGNLYETPNHWMNFERLFGKNRGRKNG